MQIRERFVGNSTQDPKEKNYQDAMTDKKSNGNKVAAINGSGVKKAFGAKDSGPVVSVDDDARLSSNKVADIDGKSPSLSSDNSCTKLTVDDEPEVCCSETGSFIFKMAVCLFCGIVFGVMFEKSRVFEPKTIRGQMVFENFIMLKMFLAASGTGQFVFCILSVIPATKEIFRKSVEEYISCFSQKGLLTSAIGAFTLGCGMTLSGACPGMVLAQLGSWVPNAIFTFLGCLIGALSYGMVAPRIQRLTRPKEVFKTNTVNQTFKLPFIAVGMPMCILLFVVVFLLEFFWKYEKDIEYIGRTSPPYDNVVTAVAWRPSVAGAFIGLIQLPLVLLIKDTMGGSTSYVTMVSQWVVTKRLQEMFPYLASKRNGVGNWWQVFYVGGAILGAAMSALASDTISTAQGVTLPAALFGGILMLWGARFAAGCTSGHGLSGMGLLAWLSFVSVPCMFGGGIMTGFAMKATGALGDLVTETLDT